MAIKYKLSKKLKKAIHKSKMAQYQLAQKVKIDRALLSLFMNNAYISEYYKDKIIKIGKLLGVTSNQCLKIAK